MNQPEGSASFGPMDLMLLGLVTVWGANFTVVKSAISEMTPLVFNALRFGSASILTLGLAALIEKDLSIVRQDWRLLFLMGLVSNSLYQLLFINGLARTRASNTSLILASVPIFVALIGTLYRSERLSKWNWLGILLSFLGLFVLIGSGRDLALGSQTLVGDLLVLAAAVTWAIHTTVVRRLTKRNSVLAVTAWLMLIGTGPLIVAALPDLAVQDWQSVSAQSWVGLALSSVLAIALGYVVWNMGVQRLGSARTSVYSYLTPLVSVVVAWAFLGETMQPPQALGAVGILVGVALGRAGINRG